MHIMGLYFLLGLGVGVVGGMVGIGGGVLLIPALTGLFGVEPRKAAGMTLAVLAVPVTLPAVWQYYVQGYLTGRDLWGSACIAVAFAIGGFTGAILQDLVSLAVLRMLLGLILLYVAVRLLIHS